MVTWPVPKSVAISSLYSSPAIPPFAYSTCFDFSTMYSVATCEARALRLTATCSNKAFITSSLGWVAVAVRSLRSFTLLVAGEPVAAFEAATRSKLFVFLDMFYFRTCNHLQSTCTQPSPSQHLPSSSWQQHHFVCHSSLLTSHPSHSLRAVQL